MTILKTVACSAQDGVLQDAAENYTLRICLWDANIQQSEPNWPLVTY